MFPLKNIYSLFWRRSWLGYGGGYWHDAFLYHPALLLQASYLYTFLPVYFSHSGSSPLICCFSEQKSGTIFPSFSSGHCLRSSSNCCSARIFSGITASWFSGESRSQQLIFR